MGVQCHNNLLCLLPSFTNSPHVIQQPDPAILIQSDQRLTRKKLDIVEALDEMESSRLLGLLPVYSSSFISFTGYFPSTIVKGTTIEVLQLSGLNIYVRYNRSVLFRVLRLRAGKKAIF